MDVTLPVLKARAIPAGARQLLATLVADVLVDVPVQTAVEPRNGMNVAGEPPAPGSTPSPTATRRCGPC